MVTSKPSLDQWLAGAASVRRDNHLQRQRRTLVPAGQMQVAENKHALINFSSNDYLGLSQDPDLAAAAARGADEFGVGSGASALVTGYQNVHEALERELADFLERDRVLLCSSGYQANLAVLGSLSSRQDTIVQDKLCHASLIDGAKLSGANLHRYPHSDIEGLNRQLQRPSEHNTMVVTDGVFSMDGDTAPLKQISRLCEATGAWLMVDDAHGIGVTGPSGKGSVAALGLSQNQVPILVGTLGKAFGCAGAFVAGSEALIEHIVNEGRTYLFTTAMSPAIVEAAREALRKIEKEEWRRSALNERIAQFQSGAKERSIPVLESESPIQPLMVGCAETAMHLSEELALRGFLVAAIRPPTVPTGSSRLRVTLSATHTQEQVELLLEAISECMVKH